MTDSVTPEVSSNGCEWLTVSEFASRIGLSRQAVYVKLSKPPLSDFVTVDNGIKVISVEALSLFSTDFEPKSEPACQAVNQHDSQPDDEIDRLTAEIDRLTELVDSLTAELDSRQSTIDAQADTIRAQQEDLAALRAQHDRVLILTDQAQQLTAAALAAHQKALDEPPERRSFWRRLFRR